MFLTSLRSLPFTLLARCAGARLRGLVIGLVVLSQPVVAVERGTLYGRAMQWTDDAGTVLRLDQWQGRKVLITMAYSTCRRTCSTTLKKLEQLQSELDRRQQPVEIVVVSYDPKNDTPKTWAEYRRQHQLLRTNWHFLTGSVRDTKQLSHLLGLADFWSYDGHILHDFRISILDPSGVIVRQVDWAALDGSALF